MKRIHSLAAPFVAVLLFSTQAASATMITVNFEAQFDRAEPILLDAGYGTGGITGSLSYDTNTLDGDLADPNRGVYLPLSGSFGFSGDDHSATTSNASSIFYRIFVGNRSSDGFLAFGEARNSSTNATGWTIASFVFEVGDSTGAAFSSDSLPTTLDLLDFDSSRFAVNLDNDDGLSGTTALYTFTSLTVSSDVPAPATLLLFGIGLAGLGLGFRRR